MIYKLLILYLVFAFIIIHSISISYNISWNKIQKHFLRLAFVALFIIMAFRNTSVGTDTYTYSILYNYVSKASIPYIISNFFALDIELGYALLMKIISLLNGSYYTFQIFISFLFCLLMYRFIRDNMNNTITGVILFISLGLYLTTFNITRQMLAVALVANAWTFLKKSQYIKFVIYVIIAVTIHLSSIISIFIFAAYAIRNNRKLYLIILIFVLCLPFIFYNVISIVSNYLPAYENYFNNTKEIQEAHLSKVLWGIEGFISLNIVFLRKYNIHDKFIALMCLINIMTNIISLYFNYFERIGLYFSPFLLLLFEIYGNSLNNKLLNRSYYIALYTCFLIFFIRSSSTDQYVYSFFF